VFRSNNPAKPRLWEYHNRKYLSTRSGRRIQHLPSPIQPSTTLGTPLALEQLNHEPNNWALYFNLATYSICLGPKLKVRFQPLSLKLGLCWNRRPISVSHPTIVEGPPQVAHARRACGVPRPSFSVGLFSNWVPCIHLLLSVIVYTTSCFSLYNL
jgi:hypothetical protein